MPHVVTGNLKAGAKAPHQAGVHGPEAPEVDGPGQAQPFCHRLNVTVKQVVPIERLTDPVSKNKVVGLAELLVSSPHLPYRPENDSVFVVRNLSFTCSRLHLVELIVVDAAVEQAQATFADARASATSSRFNVPITSVTSKSNLDSAGTAVVNAEAGFQAAQQNFESAKAVLQQAEANAAKSDADLVRYEQLVAKDDISHQQYDQAVAAAKANRSGVVSAGASVLAAEQAVHQAKGKLSQTRADLRSAETAPQQVSVSRSKAEAADAQARERKAQLDQAKLNLSYTVVRSPVTGIIGKKTVEVGQNVGIGQELVEVVPLDDVWVTANFKETQLAHMRPGQPVEIKVDAYGRTWKAHVTNMGAGAGSVFSLLPPENATGNYVKVVQRVPVRIDFDRSSDRSFDRNLGSDFNAEGLLKPGLSVEPEVKVR